MVYTPATKHPNGQRLLALDGGGVRGVMSLVVLKELMKRVQKRKGLDKEPRPVDYFELAAGTSTGGIIGVMLFRLHMTASDAIEQYKQLSEEVFKPKVGGWDISNLGHAFSSFISKSKSLIWSSRFDDGPLKDAINRVVYDYGLDDDDRRSRGDAPLQHNKAGRFFVCTTAQNRSETVLMRSYPNANTYVPSVVNNIMQEHQGKIGISLATRATSAAPTYFPEVQFLEGRSKLMFWDGGLLNNNPIDQLWSARYDLVEPEEPEPYVSCVISLGTGYVRADNPSSSWFQLLGTASSVMDFATNTNPKGKDFSRYMSVMQKRGHHAKTEYIRFNPDLKNEKIDLAAYWRMNDLITIAERECCHKKSEQVFLERATQTSTCQAYRSHHVVLSELDQVKKRLWNPRQVSTQLPQSHPEQESADEDWPAAKLQRIAVSSTAEPHDAGCGVFNFELPARSQQQESEGVETDSPVASIPGTSFHAAARCSSVAETQDEAVGPFGRDGNPEPGGKNPTYVRIAEMRTAWESTDSESEDVDHMANFAAFP
ncbi:hypothetical protein diail_7682, partial [Diaporthe ilicicola]